MAIKKSDLKKGKRYKVMFEPEFIFKILEESEDHFIIRVFDSNGNYNMRVDKDGFNDFIRKALMEKASKDEAIIAQL